MKNKITIILISSLLLLSCGNKNNYEKVTHLKEESKTIIEKESTKSVDDKSKKTIDDNFIKECQCFDGIGSSKGNKPTLTYTFSNSKTVSLCGYNQSDSKTKELLISEFNIFDCLNGKALVEYGAMENCIIEAKNDTIKIKLLKNFPSGKDWKWESVSVAEQMITSDLNKLKVSELSANYTPEKVDLSQQNTFLSNLKKGQGFGENWEDDIGKLEFLSLNGNNKAWEILKNYEEFTGEKTDGALAETWKEATATVGWLADKK